MAMTLATRAAEAAGVLPSLHRYEHDPNADSFGMEAAEKIGVPAEKVFKTLIARVDGKQLDHGCASGLCRGWTPKDS